MVKVGNSECEFLKLTPLSRTSAIAGAVCGITMRPRRPSGTNRIKFRGAAFCADAALAVNVMRLADSNTMVRRIGFSPVRSGSGRWPLPSFSFDLRQDCYTGSEPSQGQKEPNRMPIFGRFDRKHCRFRAVLHGRKAAMSKFREKAEAQTEQVIGQMLGDE